MLFRSLLAGWQAESWRQKLGSLIHGGIAAVGGLQLWPIHSTDWLRSHYTSFSAGVVSPQKWGQMAISVRDPQNRTTDTVGLSDLYSKGVIVKR